MADIDTQSIFNESIGEDPSEELFEKITTPEMIKLIYENPQALFAYYSKLDAQWFNLKEGANITLNIDTLWKVRIPAKVVKLTHNQLTLVIEALKTDGKEINADNIAEALSIKKAKKNG